MASRKGKKDELIPKGFLEDIVEKKMYVLLQESYFPPVADSAERQASINNLAASLASEEHRRLAEIAARCLLGMLEWRAACLTHVRNKLLDPDLSHERRLALQELEREWTRAKEDRRRGGQNRAAKSPKAQAKAEVYEFWQERREGKHPSLRTNEQFARECLRQHRWRHVLTNIEVITRWCTQWEKEARKAESAS